MNEHYLLVIQPLVFLTAAIPAALVAINVSEHRPMERRVRAWVGTHVRAAKRRHGGRFFESTTHIRKKVFTTLHCNRRPFQSLAHPVPKSSPYPPFQTKPGGGLTLELDGTVRSHRGRRESREGREARTISATRRRQAKSSHTHPRKGRAHTHAYALHACWLVWHRA